MTILPRIHSQPSPFAMDTVRLDIALPPNDGNRRVVAGLVHNGCLIAEGRGRVAMQNRVMVDLKPVAQAMAIAAGDYELWVTLTVREASTCHPAFGDTYLHGIWHFSGVYQTHLIEELAGWQKKKLSQPDNLVTLHYRTLDDRFSDLSLWSWNWHGCGTMHEVELFPVAYDSDGWLFQLDRSQYGGLSDRDYIGLLARFGGKEQRMDEVERSWEPHHGREVWLIEGQGKIESARPKWHQHIIDGFIDSPHHMIVRLWCAELPDKIDPKLINITSSDGNPIALNRVLQSTSSTQPQLIHLDLTTENELDLAYARHYLRLHGFTGETLLVLRCKLEMDDFFNDTIHPLGASYTSRATVFRLFAPAAEGAEVVLYDTHDEATGRISRAMRYIGRGIHEAEVLGDMEGRFYCYRLSGGLYNPEHEVADIYSINTVGDSRRGRITDLKRNHPPGWYEAESMATLTSPVDMVIYEMSVRDFTIDTHSGVRHKGLYMGFTESGTHLADDPAMTTGLDHLLELGVTHVQLLPVQDFGAAVEVEGYNWGYMPLAHNSPSGWFASDKQNESRILELKQLIHTLHQHGIGVILDVVYNHVGISAPFTSLAPGYYYRYWPDGARANGSGCGNEFSSERQMARRFILDSLIYWLREYRVDGFRFDMMALIDLETMREVDETLRAIKPDIVIYGEPWLPRQTPLKGAPTTHQTIRGSNIGAFNDVFHNTVKGYFNKDSKGFVQNGSSRDELFQVIEGSWRALGLQPGQSINYLSCHDNLVLYDKLTFSMPEATEEEIIETMKLAYLLLFTAQGVPFLHGGEEFARSKKGCDNSYDQSDEINKVDWMLKKTNYALFCYTKELISIRKQHPAFRLRIAEDIARRLTFHQSGSQSTLMFNLNGIGLEGENWARIVVIGNANDRSDIKCRLPSGIWHLVFDHSGKVNDKCVIEGYIEVRHKSGVILYQTHSC